MDSKQYFYEFGKMLYSIDGLYDEYAKKKKVKANLLWVLYALNDGKEHSQIEIATKWGLAKTTVNTIILELQEEGYLLLKPIVGERREMHVLLTEKGKRYASSLLSELYEIEKEAFQDLPFSPKEMLENLQSMKESLIKRGILGGKEK